MVTCFDDTYKIVSNLYWRMRKEWSYGFRGIDGRLYLGRDSGECNLSEIGYCRRSLSELEMEKIGCCWDYVDYEDAWLSFLGVEHTCYFLCPSSHSADSLDPVALTHTFVIFEDGSGTKYYLELSAYRARGIHQSPSLYDTVKFLQSKYPEMQNGETKVFEYHPSSIPTRILPNEFVRRVTMSAPVLVI